MSRAGSPVKAYDFLLKFRLVGDGDVGKGGILASLRDGSPESPYGYSTVLSLQDLCCCAIVSCTPVHLVEKLSLPAALRSHLKSFSVANGLNARMMHGRSYSLTSSNINKRNSLKKAKIICPPQSLTKNCARNNCKISQALCGKRNLDGIPSCEALNTKAPNLVIEHTLCMDQSTQAKISLILEVGHHSYAALE